MELIMTANKLFLNEQYFVTNGGRNLVYRHPENADLLIKVINPKFIARSSFKIKLLHKSTTINRFRLSKCYIREIIESMRLRFAQNYQHPNFIQQFTGIVDTNFGFGIVVKAERGKDGHYAKTLKTLIKANQYNTEIQKKLDEFYNALANCDISVSDCAPANLVYAYNDEVGDHFVLIDGIGEKTLIPILRISTRLRKLSRLGQINRLKKRISSDLIKYTNSYQLKS